MSKKKKEKKPTPKITIFLTFIFLGFAAGTVLGIGLKQIKVDEVVATQSLEDKA
ncbi:MAG: hypothetical protein ACRCXE_00785 [Metamycoplasmataceae bacterium]